MKTGHIPTQDFSKRRRTQSRKAPAESMWYVARSLSPYPVRSLSRYSVPNKAVQLRNELGQLFWVSLLTALVVLATR